MKLTYTEKNGYLYPDLEIPKQTEQKIGIWGIRCRNYLLENEKVTYYNLLTSGKLPEYLAAVDRQVNEILNLLIEQMKQAQGITEQLKFEQPMEWIQKMNNIKGCAKEIVDIGVIYT